jgi:REP element-mobilizing transposase RayT
LLYHIVFSTKYRRPQITPEIESRLHAYLGGLVEGQKGAALAINGMRDHVHLLVRYRTAVSIADLQRELKSSSSGWVHDEFPAAQDFAWQEGYSVFSVSKSAQESVRVYVINQKEHHRQRDYPHELLALLRLHGVEFDERYVFD